jgi:hypothetical protein
VTGGSGGGGPGLDQPTQELTTVTGARRLTVAETNQVLFDLLGEDSAPARRFLPEDLLNPFDNDWVEQEPSVGFVEGADSLARYVTERLLADTARLDSVVGCSPSGAGDQACMEEFIRRFGRRALRRPLREEEVQQYLALQDFGVQANDFYVGVETVLWAILQDPEFLYRIEIGSEVEDDPTLRRLNSYEVASRLSFFLLGTTPSDDLLDSAQAAEESDEPLGLEVVGELAQQMLEDPRARQRAVDFHAQWFGFNVISNAGSLEDDMEAESAALIERVLFEEKLPWANILTFGETYLTPELAEHYGLPAPSGEHGWVPYGDSGRAGLLSHGSFLTVGARFSDSSPIQRGLAVRTRLLCQVMPPPPPDVNVDDPLDGAGECKWDHFSPTREGTCYGCHALINPIGWGLEGYDRTGAHRTTDVYGCDLGERTVGEVPGLGTFSGPGELGHLLADSQEIRTCLTTQLYRFAMGRSELREEDNSMIAALAEAQTEDILFDQLIVDLTSSRAFIHRKIEE